MGAGGGGPDMSFILIFLAHPAFEVVKIPVWPIFHV